MSLEVDLLKQAEHLMMRGRGRPKQADLRRAVSVAYYALFHLLTNAAAKRLIGNSASASALRNLTARAFNHQEMQSVCKSFRNNYGALPQHLQALLPNRSVPAELIRISNAFIDLQQARHEADYDQARYFNRTEVEASIAQATDAFDAWEAIRRTPEAKAFLLALLLDKKWKR